MPLPWSRLVWCGAFDVIDHEHIERRFGRVEFQSKLFLESAGEWNGWFNRCGQGWILRI